MSAYSFLRLGKHGKRSPVPAVVACIAAAVAIACAITFVMLPKEVEKPLPEDFPSDTADHVILDTREIVCWGDSLTRGDGADEAVILTGATTIDVSYLSYPQILEMLTGIRTYNFGVSGATSAEIAYMQCGLEMESGQDDYDDAYDDGYADDYEYGYDYYYDYGYDYGYDFDYEWENEEPQSHIDYDLIERANDHPGDIIVIEMGSNGGWAGDLDVLISQYHAMLEHANTDSYIIIGDTDDPELSLLAYMDIPLDYGMGYDETAWEAALREEFGEHFINMRVFLAEYGLEIAHLVPTDWDEVLIKNGCVPQQLRADWTHLNSYGYYAKAVIVYNKGKELGYWE